MKTRPDLGIFSADTLHPGERKGQGAADGFTLVSGRKTPGPSRTHPPHGAPGHGAWTLRGIPALHPGVCSVARSRAGGSPPGRPPGDSRRAISPSKALLTACGRRGAPRGSAPRSRTRRRPRGPVPSGSFTPPPPPPPRGRPWERQAEPRSRGAAAPPSGRHGAGRAARGVPSRASVVSQESLSPQGIPTQDA